MTIIVNNRFIPPLSKEEFKEFINTCKKTAKKHNLDWDKDAADTLKEWHEDRNKIYKFKNLKELIENISVDEDELDDEIVTIVSKAQLKRAKERRMIHRLGRVFELCVNQVSKIAPGIKNLSKDQLLPLDHHWKKQRQRWQERTDGQYVQLKPKGLTEEEETQVSVFGDRDDPSMLYWRDDRQLGHRYKAIENDDKNAFNHGASKHRTYGSKKSEGGIYKIKNLVDGHAIQACNDQRNLDKHSEYKTAELHPHNMYWENPAFGKYIRQKWFEAYALREEISLLQINEYEDYDDPTQYNPHKGEKTLKKIKCIVPDRVHILMKREDKLLYCDFNNEREADYGDLDYKKENGEYKKSPLKKSLNRKIKDDDAGIGIEDHVDANERPPEEFPAAQILDTSEPESLEPDKLKFRKEDKEYQSPPPSPYYLSPFLKKKEEPPTAGRIYFEGQELKNDNNFVEKVEKNNIVKLTLQFSELWKSRKESKEKKEVKKQVSDEESDSDDSDSDDTFKPKKK